jgi:hypothetical protein
MEARRAASRITVDGEVFEVEADPERPGHYHFARLSGPGGGSGFSTARSDGSLMSEGEMQASIRNFLEQVDPDTGHIE